jgi:hypothetical protein
MYTELTHTHFVEMLYLVKYCCSKRTGILTFSEVLFRQTSSFREVISYNVSYVVNLLKYMNA